MKLSGFCLLLALVCALQSCHAARLLNCDFNTPNIYRVTPQACPELRAPDFVVNVNWQKLRNKPSDYPAWRMKYVKESCEPAEDGLLVKSNYQVISTPLDLDEYAAKTLNISMGAKGEASDCAVHSSCYAHLSSYPRNCHYRETGHALPQKPDAGVETSFGFFPQCDFAELECQAERSWIIWRNAETLAGSYESIGTLNLTAWKDSNSIRLVDTDGEREFRAYFAGDEKSLVTLDGHYRFAVESRVNMRGRRLAESEIASRHLQHSSALSILAQRTNWMCNAFSRFGIGSALAAADATEIARIALHRRDIIATYSRPFMRIHACTIVQDWYPSPLADRCFEHPRIAYTTAAGDEAYSHVNPHTGIMQSYSPEVLCDAKGVDIVQDFDGMDFVRITKKGTVNSGRETDSFMVPAASGEVTISLRKIEWNDKESQNVLQMLWQKSSEHLTKTLAGADKDDSLRQTLSKLVWRPYCEVFEIPFDFPVLPGLFIGALKVVGIVGGFGLTSTYLAAVVRQKMARGRNVQGRSLELQPIAQ